MLHFTCDLCGRQLDDRRFVAKMEVFPAFDPDGISEDDLDQDNLQEISELLDEMEHTGVNQTEDCSAQRFRFDLCTNCHQTFLTDPLGRNTMRPFNFSGN